MISPPNFLSPQPQEYGFALGLTSGPQGSFQNYNQKYIKGPRKYYFMISLSARDSIALCYSEIRKSRTTYG